MVVSIVSLPRRRRFCAVAASRNSSFAPLGRKYRHPRHGLDPAIRPSVASTLDAPVGEEELNRSPLEGLRILLAEDDYLIAMEMEATLQSLGCIVIGPARSVQEIEEIANNVALDGALLDVNLRGDTIDMVLPVLVDRGVKIVLSSGYEEEALTAKYQGLALITKPYNDATLRAVCERVFVASR